MVKHLAAAVWFQEFSQRQEGGRVLRTEEEGPSIWKNHPGTLNLDIDERTCCTDHFSLKSTANS